MFELRPFQRRFLKGVLAPGIDTAALSLPRGNGKSALADSRLWARFQSYRLNLPSGDESTTLLTVNDWERVVARPVPDRSGGPVVGVDLGGGRPWSAAVAIWPNGRCEACQWLEGPPNGPVVETRSGNVGTAAFRRLG